MIGDAVVATAILDRLLHHAVVVQIEGASYRLGQHGPEGPSARKRTVRNENTEEIPTILTRRRRFCSGVGINCRFIACNHGMQYGMHPGLVIETPYCTQQTGGLTRGIILRAIQTPPGCAGLRFLTGSTVSVLFESSGFRWHLPLFCLRQFRALKSSVTA